MSTVAITDIGSLVTNDSNVGAGALGLITNAAIVIDSGVVVDRKSVV